MRAAACVQPRDTEVQRRRHVETEVKERTRVDEDAVEQTHGIERVHEVHDARQVVTSRETGKGMGADLEPEGARDDIPDPARRADLVDHQIDKARTREIEVEQRRVDEDEVHLIEFAREQVDRRERIGQQRNLDGETTVEVAEHAKGIAARPVGRRRIGRVACRGRGVEPLGRALAAGGVARDRRDEVEVAKDELPASGLERFDERVDLFDGVDDRKRNAEDRKRLCQRVGDKAEGHVVEPAEGIGQRFDKGPNGRNHRLDDRLVEHVCVHADILER